jgi:hypothetical protein
MLQIKQEQLSVSLGAGKALKDTWSSSYQGQSCLPSNKMGLQQTEEMSSPL